MDGTLFRYGPAPAQIAFLSAAPHSGGAGAGGGSGHAPAAAPSALRRHLVLVPGLTEGLLCLPYAPHAAAAAAAAGYALVQAQLSSAYQGWGMGSLDEDADELLLLSRHLRAALGSEGVVVMGHSTGCQDAVRFAARHGAAEGAAPLLGIVLQAPASDREWLFAFHPDLVACLPAAQALVDAGRGAEVVCPAFGAPLSARRLVALAARLGDDDMFSTDLTPAELSERLGHLRAWPLLVLQSGSDECVPDASSIPLMGERILEVAGGGWGGAAAGAWGVSGGAAGEDDRPASSVGGGGRGSAGARRHVVIPGAPHSAEGHEDAVARAVEDFLLSLQQAGGRA